MKADVELDISAESCPMTFVRTKIKLEAMSPGQLLRVRLKEGEPLINVPRAVLDHGHAIIRMEPAEAGIATLWIQVKA